MPRKSVVPDPPEVIAPSPTGTDAEDGPSLKPLTRSAAKKLSSGAGDVKQNGAPIKERRGRSRTPEPLRQRATGGGATAAKAGAPSVVQKSEPIVPPALVNGFLSPASAAATARHYWRELSRSPSPLGLIPIHKSWRSLIHRHEVPRKVLHVSIGFFTLYLYCSGLEKYQIHPWLLAAALPVAAVDFARHRSAGFNRVYVRFLGALMRETEVNDKYNGVVFYLFGAWWSLLAYPKDVAVVSILLLSWCDTAASTFGRLYGRYTPRVRKGKSLAGSIAAAVVGALAAASYYGYFVPRYGSFDSAFQFKGVLNLPLQHVPGQWVDGPLRLTHGAALAVVAVASGLIASFSEAIDIFGIDDNLTIPVISGALLWGFLRLLA